jgi:hypothetical protein
LRERTKVRYHPLSTIGGRILNSTRNRRQHLDREDFLHGLAEPHEAGDFLTGSQESRKKF